MYLLSGVAVLLGGEGNNFLFMWQKMTDRTVTFWTMFPWEKYRLTNDNKKSKKKIESVTIRLVQLLGTGGNIFFAVIRGVPKYPYTSLLFPFPPKTLPIAWTDFSLFVDIFFFLTRIKLKYYRTIYGHGRFNLNIGLLLFFFF